MPSQLPPYLSQLPQIPSQLPQLPQLPPQLPQLPPQFSQFTQPQPFLPSQFFPSPNLGMMPPPRFHIPPPQWFGAGPSISPLTTQQEIQQSPMRQCIMSIEQHVNFLQRHLTHAQQYLNFLKQQE